MIAKMKRSLWVGIAMVVTAGGLLAPLVASQQKVSAKNYEVGDQVTICHRTNSDENSANPYNQITVSINAAGATGLGDHYSNHNDNLGVVIYNSQIHTQMKNAHEKWGDIIPPTSAHPAGLNWTAAGQAVWNNGCNYAKVADASVSVTPATCATGATLVYGAIVNATWDPASTPDGTIGVAPGTPYSVTAIANADALFNPDAATKLVGSGTLAGALGYQNTNPEGTCYQTVPDATATVSVTPATCDAAAKLVWGGITHAVFSGTADGTTGPASYDVTATAATGHTFAGGDATLLFKGELDGPLTEGCGNPEVTLATAGVKINPATCKVGETISYVNVKNATVREGSTAEGVHVDAFTVTFDATNDAVFDEEGATSLVISDKLAGPSTDPSCEEGQVLGETSTPKTVAAPVQLPKTSSEGSAAIAVSGTLLAVVGGVVALRRFFDRGL